MVATFYEVLCGCTFYRPSRSTDLYRCRWQVEVFFKGIMQHRELVLRSGKD
ncbi:MAG: hypothetical protein OJF51_000074 [Nitrospira sp.]|nr:MAG: hypothetical protein OJF51_000074 [Nitrospira sp.]